MAKPAAPDKNFTGMAPDEMRSLLRKSKLEPVSCAIGLGSNPALGMLVLDKRKAPEAMRARLKEAVPDVSNIRVGRAEVDEAVDPTLVNFYLTKPVSGMGKKLAKSLKLGKTGFMKAKIWLEELDENGKPLGPPVQVEAAEEEADEADMAASDGAVAVSAAPPTPEAAAPSPSPKPDMAALARELAALVPRIAVAGAADEALLLRLKKLATDCKVNIQTSNPTYAAAMLLQLRAALEPAPASTVPVPPPPPPAAAAAADPSPLKRELAGLIPRIPAAAGTDAARLAQLKKLATDCTVNISTGNLTYAATGLAQLRQALDGAAPAAGAAPVAAPAVTPPAADAAAMGNQLNLLLLNIIKVCGGDPALEEQLRALAAQAGAALSSGGPAAAKPLMDQLIARMAAAQKQNAGAKPGDLAAAGKLWQQTRTGVEGELAKLRAAIMAAYEGAVSAEIGQRFDERVGVVMTTLGGGLSEKIQTAAGTTDGEARQRACGEAREIVQGFQSFIQADALLSEVDANPFVSVAVRAPIETTLSELARQLR